MFGLGRLGTGQTHRGRTGPPTTSAAGLGEPGARTPRADRPDWHVRGAETGWKPCLAGFCLSFFFFFLGGGYLLLTENFSEMPFRIFVIVFAS